MVVEETRKLPVGTGLEPDRAIGPLISGRHRERVEGLIAGGDLGRRDGSTGGKRARPARATSSSRRCSATSRRMAAFADEVFGPVFALTSFDQLDDAIAPANATRYGLAAYVFTNDSRGDARVRAARVRHDRRQRVVAAGDRGAVRGPQGQRARPRVRARRMLDNLETKLVSFGGLT